MALVGSVTAGHQNDNSAGPLQNSRKPTMGSPAGTQNIKGSSRLFGKKNPGSGGKLGKTSALSAGLSRLRGKGALA